MPVTGMSSSKEDVARSGQRSLNLWIVNQYAQPEGEPGIARHSTLSRLMEPYGVVTTILAGDRHYWSGRTGGLSANFVADSDRRIVIRTAGAESNGLKRIIDMVVFSVKALTQGWRAGQRAAPDVVLGSSPHPFGAVAAWALAKRHRSSFVLEVRDIWPKSLVTMLGTPEWHPFVILLAWMERFLYSRADAIITLLPGSEEHIQRVWPGCAPIHWIPNGVEIQAGWVPPDAALPHAGFVAMYAGAHGIPNSLDTLIRAAGIVGLSDATNPPLEGRLQVVLVGDGKEKSNLQRLATDLGVDNVSFRDPVPKAEVMGLLSDADVLVLTLMDSPVFRDGISPNKLFDYMASARPVVMSVETPLDPVRAADAGVTVPPGDPEALAKALVAMRQTPAEQRAEMGRRGRQYVEANHDMQTLAQRFAAVLQSVARP